MSALLPGEALSAIEPLGAARASAPGARGERLFPQRTERVYWHLTALRRAIEAVVERHLAGRRVGTLVDYGCGDAPYRPLFEPRVAAYLACDRRPGARVDAVFGDDGELPVEASSADIVLSSQVLEHVDDPPRYLAECRRVLAPGGRLILSTHGVWKFHPDPGDYWRFTSQGLDALMRGCGFEVLECRGVMGPAATGLQLFQDALLGSLPRRLWVLLTAPLQRLIELADRFTDSVTRDRDAAVYVVVATPSDDALAD